METDHDKTFDEVQSLQVIKEMITTSQQKLKNDGILFILWGWTAFINYLSGYLLSTTTMTFRSQNIFRYTSRGLAVFAIVFTIYYIIRQRKKVQTYIGISLRYVWISLFLSMVLVNLIQFNILNQINFELQHPIFMVLIAFAIVVTGGILRYKLLIGGGIVFGILAYVSSYFRIEQQQLIEAIAWFIAFIIPGHIMHSKRKG